MDHCDDHRPTQNDQGHVSCGDQNGIVEVTEDHALFREDGSECRATDVISNETKLALPPSSRVDSTMSEEMSMLARILIVSHQWSS